MPTPLAAPDESDPAMLYTLQQIFTLRSTNLALMLVRGKPDELNAESSHIECTAARIHSARQPAWFLGGMPMLCKRGSRAMDCFLFALFLLFAGGPAHADDWPQWLGPQRDAVWRETGILEKFPEKGPVVRWRTAIAAGYSGPAVADGRVYVMDRLLAEGAKNPTNAFMRGKIPGRERVLCLNEADGKELWKHEYDCTYTISYPLGPRTTPLVHDRKLYTLGAEGNLCCLDAVSGKVFWSHDLASEYQTKAPVWGYAAHPLLDGQKLICMVGGKGSTAVAFDKDSGKELWRSLEAKNLGYCPPMIYEAAGKRQLIIWHGEAVNGLDPETGKTYWTIPFTSYQSMSISTPRKVEDFLFLTSTFGGSLMLRLGNDHPGAEVAWRGNVKKNSFDSVFGTPFVENGHVYGTSSDGELVCIKAETGERLWSTLEPNGGKKVRSADIFLVKNGDRFFLATEKGNLIIARLSPKGYEEISRAHLLDPTSAAFGREVVWSHPAFANRSVYARNDKEIVCFSLSTSEAGKGQR
jgi:outer membrane protein assembly factor BamB